MIPCGWCGRKNFVWHTICEWCHKDLYPDFDCGCGG